MKIGFISDSIGKESTGIGYYSFNLLKSLHNEGHEITIIDYVKKDILKKYSKKFLIIENRFPFLKTLLWHFFLLNKIKKNDFDLIVNPSFFPNVLGNANNLVFTVHDLSMVIYPQHTKIGKGIYYRLFLPGTLKKASKVLADSENTKIDVMKMMKIDEKKIYVLHPCLDSIFKKIKNETIIKKVKNKYLLPNKYYLYVGTVEPRKNIENIFKAFDLTYEKNKIPLVVVGKKGWKDFGIKKTFNKLKHKERIIFTGYVDREDLPAIYSLASLFIFPSFYEGFGFPPLEAMACGCPVVTSNNSSLAEICGESAAYVNPYSVDDISKKMTNILKNKSFLKEIKNKGLIQSKKFTRINLPFFAKIKNK